MTRTTLRRQLGLAVAIAVTAVPSAWARPIDDFPRTGSSDGAPQVRILHESGFDWADAGAGAGAAFAATMIGVGGALAVKHRHRRLRPGAAA